MKCREESCKFCTLNPKRLPEDMDISFLPDPMLDESGERYKDFQQVLYQRLYNSAEVKENFDILKIHEFNASCRKTTIV